MNIQVTARSIYELGQRSNQEDYIYPALSGQPSGGDLFILCDGMGGHDKGEVASQTVCDTMSAYVRTHLREDGLFDEQDFRKALDAAYDALDAKDTATEKKMGTTLTFVKFHAGGCFIAHIGDSRVYVIRPATKSILHVTRDHSLVNDLVALGELTPEQARTSRQKNIITRAMQPHQETRAQADCINLTDLKPGDYIYMCSDGMLEISEDNEIVNILSMERSDAEKIEILKGATSENRDNHSAHLIRIVSVEEGAQQPVVTPKPAAAAPASAPKPTPKPTPNPAPASKPKPRRRTAPFLWVLLVAGLAFGAWYWFQKPKPELTPKPDEPKKEEVTQPRQEDPKPVMTPPNTEPKPEQKPEQTPEQTPEPLHKEPDQQQPSQTPPEPVQNQVEAAAEVEAEAEANAELEFGILKIETRPTGASVWIDGKVTKHKTNITIPGVSIGNHTIELKLDKYQTITKSVTITGKRPPIIISEVLIPKEDEPENE